MNVSKPSLEGASDHGAPFPSVIRIAARVLSILFHPLFIPVYLSWFLIYVNPLFPAFSAGAKLLLLIRFLVMYTIFPLVTVLIAKGLGFIDSILLKTQRDRIIPYVACGLYYFWMWYVLKNQPEFPRHLVMLSLAIFLASSAGLTVNSFVKVSMHTISMGVACTFLLLFAFMTDVNFGFYISAAFLLAGLVCTARLINDDHSTFEVYLGLVLGIIAQLVAYWVM
ncbi:hypothetical protein V9K67_09555 [Paraflavisolibacter sp. H34]|uniref:hypothetical protein n=1 Tax=Huijunlia imazamoxiresistens TaxID=3127457 RepID=UPI003017247D